jgi:hypothetical protein
MKTLKKFDTWSRDVDVGFDNGAEFRRIGSARWFICFALWPILGIFFAGWGAAISLSIELLWMLLSWIFNPHPEIQTQNGNS